MAELRLLVDGIAFGPGPAEGRDPWRPVLEGLAATPGVVLHLLDRGGAPAPAGARMLPFPDHGSQHAPADSELLQAMCDLYRIDVFCSTGWTTPLHTPAVMVLWALPPGAGVPAAGDRSTMEFWTALAFAQRYVCPSGAVAGELLRLCPEVPPSQVDVAGQSDDGDGNEEPAAAGALAATLAASAGRLSQEARAGAYDDFFARWTLLRRLQAQVDFTA